MWSLGTLIAFPISVLAVVALVVTGVALGRRTRTADTIDAPLLKGLSIGAYVCALLLTIATASPLGMWPYKAEYHRYAAKSGVVTAVNRRIVSSGDSSISQKFVVRFKGSRQEYGCEDTRCAVIDKGDRITLACKRTWQYAGTDGWDCNFVRNGGAS